MPGSAVGEACSNRDLCDHAGGLSPLLIVVVVLAFIGIVLCVPAILTYNNVWPLMVIAVAAAGLSILAAGECSERRRSRGPALTKGSLMTKSRDGRWLFVIPGLTAVAALVLAIALQINRAQRALSIATWVWFAAILVSILFAWAWSCINDEFEQDLSSRLRKGSEVLLTVDGVVLGLVYKFTENTLPVAAKVGGLALLVSLMLALLVYSLVSGKISPGLAVAVSTGFFNLSGFALVYGLTCIVFALILRS